MKTKIIYISGNEIFDMADIRAAFEEVRNTLNLDKDTVLFGVPVDNDDAGLMASNETQMPETKQTVQPDIVPEEIVEQIQPTENTEIIEDITEDNEVVEPEQIVEEPVKKRGRTRKTKSEPKNSGEESERTENADEKIVPILSVLSSKENSGAVEDNNEETTNSPTVTTVAETNIEIIEDIVEASTDTQEPVDIEPDANQENAESEEDTEPDLEKLLSAMKPLQEDILDESVKPVAQETENNDEEDEDNIDATLEQLATEFVQTQDKIASESKSSGRGKIGKLRNILPFKQSKHKDQGLGDLFGWAGVAANDEDFSVPGFFTNATSKK